MTLRALVGDGNDSLEVFRFLLTAKASSFKQTKLTIKYNGELYFSNKCKKSSRLVDTGTAAEYEKAVNKLNAYFIPKLNSTHQKLMLSVMLLRLADFTFYLLVAVDMGAGQQEPTMRSSGFKSILEAGQKSQP